MNPSKKRACGLIRVSSEEQAKGGYGLEFQEADIRTFCERNGLALVNIFRDEGYSGSTAARPGFQEMMAWAREKRFDILVVWKLDRLFRDTKLTLQTVDELSGLDIEFRSVQEAFTHDSNGRFLLTIFAAGAEKERKDIAMRMHAGRIASAKKGTWIAGAGNPPFGYCYNPATKRLEIEGDEARVVRQIFRWLVGEKLSLYKIQARLNDMKVPTKFDRTGRKKPSGSTCWWGKRTIGRILGNEVYTGTFTFRKYARADRARRTTNLRPEEDWLVSHCPPIISTDIFRKAQEQLKRNSENSPRRTNALYLLSHLLICGHDNRHMHASIRRSKGGRRVSKFYVCSAIRKRDSAVPCPSATITESRIAPPIWAKMKELLADPVSVLGALAHYRERQLQSGGVARQVSALQARIRKSTVRLGRLAELYLGEAVDKEFFQAEQARLKGELGDFERELRKLKDSEITQAELAGRARSITDLYAAYKSKLDGASDAVKREIFQTFIKCIVVRGEDLDIEVMLPPMAPAGRAHSDFAGQPPYALSRKDTLTLFLQTKLVPISKILREKKLHENFTANAGRSRGGPGPEANNLTYGNHTVP